MKGPGRFIVKHRIIILVIAFVLLIPSVIGILHTDINYDILSYLPKNLDSTKAQEVMNKDFSDTGATVLILEDTKDIDVINIKNQLLKIDGIANVMWTNDFLDITVPKEMLPDKVKTTFYSKNNTSLYISFSDSGVTGRTQNAIGEIRELVGDKGYLAGMSGIVKDTKDLADQEKPLFIVLAIFLCIVILALTMHSTFIPLFFMIGIGCAIAYNLGTNVFLGEISYITNSLAAVLQLGVTMDFSIFLLHRYEEEKLKCIDKYEAMEKAINMTLVSITGSSLTTIAGFLSLGIMELTLGKDIGIVMAKGVIFGVLCTITVLPSMILQFDNLIHKYSHKTILPSFDNLSSFVVKRRKLLFLIFILTLLPAVYGKTNTKAYYNMINTLPKDMKSIVATNKLKQDYNMTTTHFILVSDKLQTYETKEIIKGIESLDGIEKVLAAELVLGERFPEDFIPEELLSRVKSGGYKLMMINSAYAAASDEENEQLEKIHKIINKYDKNALIGGEGALTKDLIEVSDLDFKRVSIVSIIAIFVIILIIFKSISLPIILVLAIELAIFINMGLPFYMGVEIPFISSIVIGCIQLGATVDYAILLTTRFKEELNNAHDRLTAMKIAIKESASSIVTSGLTFFAATFGVSLISKLEVIKSLCNLIARGAIISMFTILIILPPLLLLFEKTISKTTLGWRNS